MVLGVSNFYGNRRDEFIIFIGGYKDFEYVRKALEYGVEYYCLKPLTYKEIRTSDKYVKT